MFPPTLIIIVFTSATQPVGSSCWKLFSLCGNSDLHTIYSLTFACLWGQTSHIQSACINLYCECQNYSIFGPHLPSFPLIWYYLIQELIKKLSFYVIDFFKFYWVRVFLVEVALLQQDNLTFACVWAQSPDMKSACIISGMIHGRTILLCVLLKHPYCILDIRFLKFTQLVQTGQPHFFLQVGLDFRYEVSLHVQQSHVLCSPHQWSYTYHFQPPAL